MLYWNITNHAINIKYHDCNSNNNQQNTSNNTGHPQQQSSEATSPTEIICNNHIFNIVRYNNQHLQQQHQHQQSTTAKNYKKPFEIDLSLQNNFQEDEKTVSFDHVITFFFSNWCLLKIFCHRISWAGKVRQRYPQKESF